ncbi:Histidinol-phosphate aminotransferase [Fulvivirga imtechensis AK7]|uniref:Histidinol-phosphate aminotransferase n=1 Tax=Fulvivirga imtechensis AK7 TaxID=1237149 RepID=L8JPX8_9BACT|nr:histidinol-phosphate transaminase [Fulvivirga imtechensis]ELR70890.1 Histidinol-phosphate aminotransferase [Fulvivirga imtechensis AK7]
MNALEKIRPNILNLQPYSSARDEFEGDGEVFLDANENPYQTGMNRYPDPYQRAVKKELAKLKNLSEKQIFLGNGSDEAIDLIIRMFCEPGKDNIITPEPTYGMYQVSAAINNIAIKKTPLSSEFELFADDMLMAADANTRVAFVCSPNNPSGNALDQNQVIKLLEDFDGIVVVDEAYIDFSSTPSFTGMLNKFNNLIVLQTFSKAWGMAGLRLGMAYASEELINVFNKVKPPYNINALTQTEALKKLGKPERVADEVKLILQQREWLERELSSLPIVEKVFPSNSNFLLVRFHQASDIFKYLIEKEIIVRDRTKVKYCENCLRISVGTEKENKTLLTALRKYQS